VPRLRITSWNDWYRFRRDRLGYSRDDAARYADRRFTNDMRHEADGLPAQPDRPDESRRTRADIISEQESVRRADAGARRFGYTIEVEAAPEAPPYAYRATARKLAAPGGEPRFLAVGSSAPEAARAGLKVLLSVLRGDDFWPEA
jgi:hypothetical protein